MSIFFLSFLVWGVTIISLGGLALILVGVDPFNASISTLILFFSSVFVGLGGVLSLAGYYLRDFLFQKNNLGNLATAVRQGFLFSILVVSILVMYATNTFILWQAVLLGLVVVLLEFYLR